MRVQFTVDKVPFYKHTEEFRLDEIVSMNRRDKKSGMQHAVLRAVPEGVQVKIKLDPPFSGACVLCFILLKNASGHGQLVDSHDVMAAKTSIYESPKFYIQSRNQA